MGYYIIYSHVYSLNKKIDLSYTHYAQKKSQGQRTIFDILIFKKVFLLSSRTMIFFVERKSLFLENNEVERRVKQSTFWSKAMS